MTEIIIQLCKDNFNEKFYLENYPKFKNNISPFDHFMSIGVFEGRSPNDWLDIPRYISENLDVLNAGINPYYHYFSHGKQEGRPIYSTTLYKNIYRALNNGKDLNYLKILKLSIDESFYLEKLKSQFPVYKDIKINSLLHYSLVGWLLKLQTSNNCIDKYGSRGIINPLIIDYFSRMSKPKTTGLKANLAPFQSNVTDHFDTKYYLRIYPDVKKSKIDPLKHFLDTGWREGRNPSSIFNTKFYISEHLHSESDASTNPLVHYVNTGLHLRLKTKPDSWKDDVLLNLDSITTPILNLYHKENSLTIKTLQNSISKGKVILSLSQDLWHDNSGGIQLFIKREFDEARKQGFLNYLHFSPKNSSDITSLEDQELNCSLNGKYIGTIPLSNLNQLKIPSTKIIIHSLLGYSGNVLKFLQDQSLNFNHIIILYLHDYFLICENYNLLRNNIEYCHAPSPLSQSCAICAFGKKRVLRTKRINSFIRKTKALGISPSKFTTELYRNSINKFKIITIPHLDLIKSNRRVKKDKKIRIGYVGGIQPSKGYKIFEKSADLLKDSTNYEFYHINSSGFTPTDWVSPIKSSTTKSPLSTINKIKSFCIDIIFIPSIWPETFSFVATEALISGCSIICFKDSGNIKDLVTQHDQGHVYDDEEFLYKSIINGDFSKLVNKLASNNYFHDFIVRRGAFDVQVNQPDL